MKRKFAAFLRLQSPVLLAGLLLSACVSSAPRPPSVPAAPATAAVSAAAPLKAVLFGYIPDSANDQFKSLVQSLTQGFQAAQPKIPVNIVIDPSIDLYDLAEPAGTLATLLGDGPDAADVVEIDSILLGDLVSRKWVQPLAIKDPDILPEAWTAATVNRTLYGAPTYLCTNVIYARDSRLAYVTDGPDLLKLLTLLSSKTPLVGNYAGSWTLPSTYLDGWADTNGTGGLAGAYRPPVDAETISSFAPLVTSCESGTKNPCLDGTYSEGSLAEAAFASGEANGFFGYTERLFYILQAGPAQPAMSVISAPLGLHTQPVIFVDLLVVNPNCTGGCLENARAFIQFMTQLDTRNLIAFSQDAPQGTLPRYLLQANTRFYSDALAQGDPYYPSFWQILQVGKPFPNEGFPEDRRILQAAVLKALEGTE